PEDYTIVWICATRTEYTAAQAFLDDIHKEPGYEEPGYFYGYTFGQIGRHNIVLLFPSAKRIYRQSPVVTVVRNIPYHFHNIRFCLSVGSGGGAPSAKHDIRLGDVIVGYSPAEREGSVIQYKTRQIPEVLRAAIDRLTLLYAMERHTLKEAIDTTLDKNQSLGESYKRPATDRLYQSHFVHRSDSENNCAVVCGDDPSSFVQRPERVEDGPTIHYGLIASAYAPMKDALVRDKLSELKDILCFEQEATGFSGGFPCLVIRGICDYSDSHHNERWQGYAAMTTAAFAKQLLCEISPGSVEAEPR
ncbi:hypothetical protein TRIATDRAFT_178317, partial [Trichoderma atroviride IMI 206040]